ncbi:MAG: hypothetical protein ACJASU_001014 [Cognaticolwellia sp.]|jgi:hypothetical protein
MSNERAEMIALVNEACKSGAKQESACNTLGISAKTLQR